MQPECDYPNANHISEMFPDVLVISKVIDEFDVSTITSYKAGDIIQQCNFEYDEDHG